VTTRKRAPFLWISGIALSALFLWLALRNVDAAALWAAAARAQLWQAVPFLILLFAFYWIKAIRWQVMLAPIRRLPASTFFPPIMIGYAGSMVLPMQLGELLRAYVASKRLGLAGTPVLASILLERMFDFLTLIVLVGVALLAGVDVPPQLATAGYVIAGIAGPLVLLLLAYLIWTRHFVSAARMLTGFLPRSVQAPFLHHLELGAMGLHVLRKPALLAQLVAYSVLQWGFMWACVHISLAALGLSLSVSAVFVTLAFTIISVALPTSPGFVGSIQIAYVFSLHLYGVQAEDAFAASVFFHALTNGSVILTGLYFLHRMGYTFGQIRSEAVQTAEQHT
jgi:uncharacterized protein (TIRG00374 family)